MDELTQALRDIDRKNFPRQRKTCEELLQVIFNNNDNLLPFRLQDVDMVGEVLRNELTEIESAVVVIRHDFVGAVYYNCKSFTKIADILTVNKETFKDIKRPVSGKTASQIYQKAIQKLRQSEKLLWLFRDYQEKKLRDLEDRVRRLES